MSWTQTDPVQIGDTERYVVDVLDDFPELDEFTKGVGVPSQWKSKPPSPLHLQVAQDGEFLDHPVRARVTIRVVAWGHKPTETKRLAHLAQGLLLGEPNISDLTGVIPTRDNETDAELAWFTVRVKQRSTQIP